jgi:hypothetical protein
MHDETRSPRGDASVRDRAMATYFLLVRSASKSPGARWIGARDLLPFRPHITFLPPQTHHCAIRSLGATPMRMSKRSRQSNACFRQGQQGGWWRLSSKVIAATPRIGAAASRSVGCGKTASPGSTMIASASSRRPSFRGVRRGRVKTIFGLLRAHERFNLG